MIYGYARVSTVDQDLLLQRRALEAAGCDEIAVETASGAQWGRIGRPVLDGLLARLQPGDQLVAWKLDRVGRSTIELLTLVRDLKARGVTYRSLTEQIDTSRDDPAQDAFLTIMSAIAEMERRRIKERQAAGIAARKAEGLPHGRPWAMPPETIRKAMAMMADGVSVNRAAKAVGVPRSSLQRALQRHPTALRIGAVAG